MRKGYYLFRECGALSDALAILSAVSLVIAGIIIIANDIHTWHLGLFSDNFYFSAHHAWVLFFVLLSIIMIVANIVLHKICRDIATLLKEIKEKSN